MNESFLFLFIKTKRIGIDMERNQIDIAISRQQTGRVMPVRASSDQTASFDRMTLYKTESQSFSLIHFDRDKLWVLTV